jgi:hypothetical protein
LALVAFFGAFFAFLTDVAMVSRGLL